MHLRMNAVDLTPVMISCRNLNGGFLNSLSVSTGLFIILPNEPCVAFIIVSLTSDMISFFDAQFNAIYLNDKRKSISANCL